MQRLGVIFFLNYGIQTGPLSAVNYLAVGDQPHVANGYWYSTLNERPEWPDLLFYVHKALLEDNVDTIDFSVELMQTKTEGSVRLRSSNVDDLPLIDPKLLEDPGDLIRMLEGFSCYENYTFFSSLLLRVSIKLNFISI